MAKVEKHKDPETFKQAVQERKHWIDAMNEELQAMERNNTWEINDFPEGKGAIENKQIYIKKFYSNGLIDKHKARLVIFGHLKKYGLDYKQTSALVEKLIVVQALLEVVSMEGWIT